MKLAIAALFFLATGCGAILNGSTKTIMVPAGATVDGVPGPIQVSQKNSHNVQFPDGRMCVVESGVSAGYAIADILLTGLLGVVIDGVTGDWKTLSADSCPGVVLN